MRKNRFATILVILFSISVHAWDLNDVTYIMPLPKSDTNNNLLKIYNNLNQQDLISKEVLRQIPWGPESTTNLYTYRCSARN